MANFLHSFSFDKDRLNALKRYVGNHSLPICPTFSAFSFDNGRISALEMNVCNLEDEAENVQALKIFNHDTGRESAMKIFRMFNAVPKNVVDIACSCDHDSYRIACVKIVAEEHRDEIPQHAVLNTLGAFDFDNYRMEALKSFVETHNYPANRDVNSPLVASVIGKFDHDSYIDEARRLLCGGATIPCGDATLPRGGSEVANAFCNVATNNRNCVVTAAQNCVISGDNHGGFHVRAKTNEEAQEPRIITTCNTDMSGCHGTVFENVNVGGIVINGTHQDLSGYVTNDGIELFCNTTIDKPITLGNLTFGGIVLGNNKPRITNADITDVISHPQEPQQNSESTNESRGQCALCLSAQATHIIDPCHHMCLCEDCANQYIAQQTAKGEKKCPICRREYTQIAKVITT